MSNSEDKTINAIDVVEVKETSETKTSEVKTSEVKPKKQKEVKKDKHKIFFENTLTAINKMSNEGKKKKALERFYRINGGIK